VVVNDREAADPFSGRRAPVLPQARERHDAAISVAPTDSLPVVRYDAKGAQRSLDMLRWGLVPYWAKDIKVGFANINAKAEGIETQPAFGSAGAASCRSTTFMNGAKTASGKQPYALALALLATFLGKS
jgi:putative SOS response-associated peptidase YedK